VKIFIDTSAWVAIENKRDIHYKESLTFKEEIKDKHFRLYTSNYVLKDKIIEE
jgi:predicted nucleic acid-binding protein